MKINNHNKSNLNTTNNSAVDLWFWYRSKYLILVNKRINKINKINGRSIQWIYMPRVLFDIWIKYVDLFYKCL